MLSCDEMFRMCSNARDSHAPRGPFAVRFHNISSCSLTILVGPKRYRNILSPCLPVGRSDQSSVS